MGGNILIYTYPDQLGPDDLLFDGNEIIENEPFQLDANTMLIWVDLFPEAKFRHPTAYILISASGVRVEKGGWYPVLNGKIILYGQEKPALIPSPFKLGTKTHDPGPLLQDLGKLFESYVLVNDFKPVYYVRHIDLTIMKSNPPKLFINAYGAARTAGWKNAQLKMRQYIEFPSDGVVEFDFIAKPPSGVVPQVVTGILASCTYEGDFSKWKGVRVYSETNYIIRSFGESGSDDASKCNDSSGHHIITME